jgi:hypothetical protein
MTVDPRDVAAVDRLIAKSRRVSEAARRRQAEQHVHDLEQRVQKLEHSTIPADQVQLVARPDPAPTVLPRVERPIVDPPPTTPAPRSTSKTPRLDALREREQQRRDQHPRQP